MGRRAARTGRHAGDIRSSGDSAQPGLYPAIQVPPDDRLRLFDDGIPVRSIHASNGDEIVEEKHLPNACNTKQFPRERLTRGALGRESLAPGFRYPAIQLEL